MLYVTVFVTFNNSKRPDRLLKYNTMGFPTKIQLIKRASSEQWYVNLPSAVAQAMEFEKGEIVEWVIVDKQRMILQRVEHSVAETDKE